MPTKQNQTVKQEIVIVMDKSGSMGTSRDDVIGGFNTYIGDLKKDESIDANLTFVLFDDNVHKLYSGKKLSQVDNLCTKSYNPNGGTALNDAVMEAIEDVDARVKGLKCSKKDKPQVLVIVFTDGQENGSRKYTADQVRNRRKEKEQDGWVFIFMGADMDAWLAGGQYGMSVGNTMSISKGTIVQSASYLSNRTSKAAKLRVANVSGLLNDDDYQNATVNLMTLDADDLANDAEAVQLRTTLDSNSNYEVPKSQ